ncbi:hypothetical protein IFR05_015511 [Cadophora sp. M221]|nr:hypothetical protein IFR05_015511 [Cadophora sp. M221]
MASIYDFPCPACTVTLSEDEDKAENEAEDEGDLKDEEEVGRANWEESELFSTGDYREGGFGESGRKLVQKLKKFVELGCKRCALLHAVLRRLDSSEERNTYPSEKGDTDSSEESDTDSFEGRASFRFDSLEWSWSEKISTLNLASWQTGYIRRKQTQSVKAAISTRDAGEYCKRVQLVGEFTPDRLLDLRDDRVRLVEGTKCHRYICLSHCWGNPEKLVRTTLSKKKEFQNDIPFDTLPKTFREAIDCRRLGVDFLWIDSLCIIQDSVEDWRLQSSLMADIYENAFVTVFATKARKSSQGIYASYFNADYSNEELGQRVDGLQNAHIWSFTHTDMYPECVEAMSANSVQWPLLSRAWVYQEQCLSKRRLHFGSKDVIWHCETRMVSESGVIDRGGDQTETRDYADWHSTVERYTFMDITVNSDRMIALAGIVKRILAARPRARYLAGLWESTLLFDLSWRKWSVIRNSYADPVEGRINCPLPSFSWGSIDSPIVYWTKGFTPLDTVAVLQVHYVPSGPVELGTPAEAYIKIKTPILRATLMLMLYSLDKGYEGADKLKFVDSFEGKEDNEIRFWNDTSLETMGDFQEPYSDVAVLFLGKCERGGLRQ